MVQNSMLQGLSPVVESRGLLSSCGARTPHDFSRGAQAPGPWASVVAARGFGICGPQAVAPWNVESSLTRGQTCVPCTGRQILNH